MFDTRTTRALLKYWLLVMQLLALQHCLFSLHCANADGVAASRKLDATPAPVPLDKDSDGHNKMAGMAVSDEDDEILRFVAEQAVLNDPNPLNDGFTGVKQRIATLMSQGFNSFTSPVRNYYNLIQRFMKWRTEYNNLRESRQKTRGKFGINEETNEPYLRSALGVLRVEYSKIDHQLAEEACLGYQNDDEQNLAQRQQRKPEENVDFIVKVLKLLIDHLEQRLLDLKENGLAAALDEEQLTADEEAEVEAEVARTESNVREASNRAKRIATNALVNLATNEAKRLIILIVLDTLATQAADTGLLAGSAILGKLEPIILLLGTAHSPLILSYLDSLRYSAIFKLLKYSASLFPCKISSRPRHSSGPIPIATPIFPPEAPVSETSALEQTEDSDSSGLDHSG